MDINPVTLLIIVAAIIVFAWLIIRVLSRSYIKTSAASAFGRAGGPRGAAARPLVVMNGAAWVFGFLHRIKWISMETMALEVRHLNENALITTDPQYVDIEARFFIKVGNNPESISIAARTIGGEVVDEGRVRRLVEPKINGAVRDVAAGFSLKTLLEKRTDFIREVQERLRADLAENGLILESMSILTLRPTLQGQFSTDDILGAQVARANAAVIEQALTEKNRLERMGALDRARLDAEAERERLAIEETVEKERAERIKNIALVRAGEEAEARVAQESKREEAERAHIMTERSLEEAMIENERKAAILRAQLQQSIEIEGVLKEQAVALAEEERQTRLAEATAVKLDATRKQIEADREREEALQQATTAVEKAIAEREAEIDLINTRLESEKQTIEQHTQISLETTRQKATAEADRDAAVAQAEATRTRAQAELDAARMAAIADRRRESASGLAQVQVALKRATVLEREAEALRHRMLAEAEGEMAKAEALSSHEAIARDMELARLNAEVLKAVEIARAQAIGEAISGMKMNLFGDAAMAQRLLQLVSTAQAAGPIYDALPASARSVLDGVAQRLGGSNGDGKPQIKALDSLMQFVESHYSDALDENPRLGDLIDRILSDDAAAHFHDGIRSTLDRRELRDLPLQSALALAKDWLGWEG